MEAITMKTIWKVAITPFGSVQLPAGAHLLSVAVQADRPYAWALVDPKRPLHSYRLHVFGTGHQVTDNPGRFLGTFLLPEDGLVFHVFVPDGEESA